MFPATPATSVAGSSNNEQTRHTSHAQGSSGLAAPTSRCIVLPLAPTCLVSHTACRLSRSTSLHMRSLGLGPKAVAGQRGRPHSARRGGVARARQGKKDKIIIFFLHIQGNGWPVAGVGGTKIFWGRGDKKKKNPSPLTHPMSSHFSSSRTSLFSTGYLLSYLGISQLEITFGFQIAIVWSNIASCLVIPD